MNLFRSSENKISSDLNGALVENMTSTYPCHSWSQGRHYGEPALIHSLEPKDVDRDTSGLLDKIHTLTQDSFGPFKVLITWEMEKLWTSYLVQVWDESKVAKGVGIEPTSRALETPALPLN